MVTYRLSIYFFRLDFCITIPTDDMQSGISYATVRLAFCSEVLGGPEDFP